MKKTKIDFGVSNEEYSEHNPHPDIKYIETKEWITSEGKTAKTVWYQCQKCQRYMHSLKYFGWQCPHCQDTDTLVTPSTSKAEAYQ